MSTEIPSTSTTEALHSLAPWVESIQAIKDDVDESRHVLTVFALAMLETWSDRRFVSRLTTPLLYHACEVLDHHGLVTLRMTEAPEWFDVAMTDIGRAALDQVIRDRDADIANREGRMR